MLEDQGKVVSSSFSNTEILNDYNIDNVSSDDYLETIEFKTIKRLLSEDNLEYMTDYLRTLLKVSKPNNPSCFRKNGLIGSYHTPGKRGIIYVRLSQEDLDREKGNVSKSILNQLLMLLTYCNDKEIEVIGIFYEEDISGSDGSREEWNKTLLFCELGNTDVYVCKTQARFARSIEFVEKYLHKKFIEWNIRFLSIVDNIDTYNKGNKKSSQITAMVDEWKIEEQSINTKKTLRAKNDAGQWTGSFAPYGYIEDPDDMYHLIVDEEAAKVVREIYSMYSNGMGYYKICQSLNDRKIPTPSRHKKLQGLKFVCPYYPNGAEYWNIDTIRKILLDETYDGILIQHRTERIAYNIKGFKKIPKNEQSIIACAHDRILDPEVSKVVRKKFANRKAKIDLSNARKDSKELIKAIQNNLKNHDTSEDKLLILNGAINNLENSITGSDLKDISLKYDTLREKTLSLNSELYSKIMEQVDVLTTNTSRARPGKNGEVHLFSKKVYCSVCGKSFQRNLCKSGPRKNYYMKPYLHCRNHRYAGGLTCDNTSYIRYEVLEELVLNEINKMIDKYARQNELEKNYYSKKAQIDFGKDLIVLQKENEDINKKVSRINDRFAMLYDDKAEGIISATEFVMLKNKYQYDINNFNSRIEEINKEINELREKENVTENERSILEKYTQQGVKHIEKLDRFTLEQLISKIMIGKKDENNNRPIKIFWNFTI